MFGIARREVKEKEMEDIFEEGGTLGNNKLRNAVKLEKLRLRGV